MSYPSSDRTFDLIPAGGRVGGMTAQDLASRRPQEEDTLLHGNPSCQHPPWTLDSEQLECEALLYMAPSQDVPEEGGVNFLGTFGLESQGSLDSLELGNLCLPRSLATDDTQSRRVWTQRHLRGFGRHRFLMRSPGTQPEAKEPRPQGDFRGPGVPYTGLNELTLITRQPENCPGSKRAWAPSRCKRGPGHETQASPGAWATLCDLGLGC